MTNTIIQKINFVNTTPAILYELYMNAEKHALVTGSPAEISDTEGSPFSAWDGYITGMNQKLIKNQLIVQSWLGSDWDDDAEPSTLVLFFEPSGDIVTLHMVHSHVPEKHAAAIDTGWHEFYWEPWKEFLFQNKQ